MFIGWPGMFIIFGPQGGRGEGGIGSSFKVFVCSGKPVVFKGIYVKYRAAYFGQRQVLRPPVARRLTLVTLSIGGGFNCQSRSYWFGIVFKLQVLI